MGDRETNQTMQTSSSSRRETRSENRHGLKRSIGCMAGIFHLLSRHHHHNRSRKRLPSARKKDETITSLPSPDNRPPPPPPPQESGGKKREPNRAANTEKAVVIQEFRRHSCEVPRSPTLPPEIRRSSSAGSPDSPRRPPALVARLMGLEDVPVSSPESSAAEKRRKLLGALEKCDEDLKALKRLIEAVRLAEIRVKALATVGSVEQIEVGGVKCLAGRHDLDGGDSRMEAARSAEINGEQPSPISVLDAIWSPRCRSKRQDNGKQGGSSIAAVGSTIVKPSRMSCFFLGGDHQPFKKVKYSDESCSFLHRMITVEEGLAALPWMEAGGRAAKDFGPAARRRLHGGQRRRRSSQAMVESTVSEVWEEIRWELAGRVGVVGLEGDIFGDLVEEVVMELASSWSWLL